MQLLNYLLDSKEFFALTKDSRLLQNLELKASTDSSYSSGCVILTFGYNTNIPYMRIIVFSHIFSKKDSPYILLANVLTVDKVKVKAHFNLTGAKPKVIVEDVNAIKKEHRLRLEFAALI